MQWYVHILQVPRNSSDKCIHLRDTSSCEYIDCYLYSRKFLHLQYILRGEAGVQGKEHWAQESRGLGSNLTYMTH